MLRFASGTPARLSPGVQVHLIAARYGQTPEQVREWPADDFVDAIKYYGVTGGR